VSDTTKKAQRDAEAIASLSAVMDEHDLDALSLRDGDAVYEIVRRPDPTMMVAAPAAAPATPAATDAAKPAPGASYKKIVAPLIGVFYRAPSPGAQPFVEVGDRVSVGQTICILEAMKQMNTIESEISGVVRAILPENGALVSLGEEMLWIEP
jgi:acetyl-CoA carboxylase biotin carboxyl carrier protein